MSDGSTSAILAVHHVESNVPSSVGLYADIALESPRRKTCLEHFINLFKRSAFCLWNEEEEEDEEDDVRSKPNVTVFWAL